MIELEDALHNFLTSASVGSVSWYYRSAPQGTAYPYGVFSVIDTRQDDSGDDEADDVPFEVRIIRDGNDGREGLRTAASDARTVRNAFTGPGVLNTTGSMSTFNCGGLTRGSVITYRDDNGYLHGGYNFMALVSKAK